MKEYYPILFRGEFKWLGKIFWLQDTLIYSKEWTDL